MNKKEFRKLWIQALRSGKYKQGSGCLKTGRKFCCLGVACDLYEKHIGKLQKRKSNKMTFYNDTSIHLPDCVKNALGLRTAFGNHRHSFGKYGIGERNTSLANMNDAGKTFDEIADVIESEPTGLLTGRK